MGDLEKVLHQLPLDFLRGGNHRSVEVLGVLVIVLRLDCIPAECRGAGK
jgi:hypothetical protein